MAPGDDADADAAPTIQQVYQEWAIIEEVVPVVVPYDKTTQWLVMFQDLLLKTDTNLVINLYGLLRPTQRWLIIMSNLLEEMGGERMVDGHDHRQWRQRGRTVLIRQRSNVADRCRGDVADVMLFFNVPTYTEEFLESFVAPMLMHRRGPTLLFDGREPDPRLDDMGVEMVLLENTIN